MYSKMFRSLLVKFRHLWFSSLSWFEDFLQREKIDLQRLQILKNAFYDRESWVLDRSGMLLGAWCNRV